MWGDGVRLENVEEVDDAVSLGIAGVSLAVVDAVRGEIRL